MKQFRGVWAAEWSCCRTHWGRRGAAAGSWRHGCRLPAAWGALPCVCPRWRCGRSLSRSSQSCCPRNMTPLSRKLNLTVYTSVYMLHVSDQLSCGEINLVNSSFSWLIQVDTAWGVPSFWSSGGLCTPFLQKVFLYSASHSPPSPFFLSSDETAPGYERQLSVCETQGGGVNMKHTIGWTHNSMLSLWRLNPMLQIEAGLVCSKSSSHKLETLQGQNHHHNWIQSLIFR